MPQARHLVSRNSTNRECKLITHSPDGASSWFCESPIEPQQKPTRLSNKSSIASYLASKLSSFGIGGTNNNNSETSGNNHIASNNGKSGGGRKDQANLLITSASITSSSTQSPLPNSSSAPPSPINRFYGQEHNNNNTSCNQQQQATANGLSWGANNPNPNHNYEQLAHYPASEARCCRAAALASMSRNILREFGNNDFILLFDLPEQAASKQTSGHNANVSASFQQAGANQNSSSCSNQDAALSNEQALASTPQSALGSLASLGSSAYKRPYVLHLVAPNFHDKAAWMSDMSQVSFNHKHAFHPHAKYILIQI